jgi:endonuclease/exonuclease/phosphatase family metal-dependent hydrolase
MNFVRKVLFHVFLILFAGGSASWAATGGKVTVMTRNMDAGTDFGFLVAYLQTDPSLGVQLTLQEVLKNNFPLRSSLLAGEIAAAKPDIVGLQEATFWATPVGNLDQLQLLLDALTLQGEPYDIVAINTLTSLSFPIGQFVDRDVIIARHGSALSVANTQTHLFSALLPLAPGISVLHGWLSADVTVDGNTFRFVTTHVESSGSLYGSSAVDLIQAAQAYELATTLLATSPFPLVIAGDFNSNGTHTPPEQTPSFKIMLQASYVDVWSALHRGIPGFTWPLYLEDPLRAHTQGPFERIDYVFARGLTATSVERTGLKPPFPSDHAGVLATFGF